MNNFILYLPPYLRLSKIIQEILNAESKSYDKIDIDIEDLNNQLFVDTATWGLAIYEKELKLPIRPNKSLEERRSIIKAKWRGTGKVDAEMIKAIVKAFTNSDVEVTFNGRIKIEFTNRGTVILNMEDMFKAIEEIKPAHLGCDIAMTYKQKISEIYVASVILGGEEITVYPYSPKDINSKGNIYIATGSNTGLDTTTVYPRKEVI